MSNSVQPIVLCLPSPLICVLFYLDSVLVVLFISGTYCISYEVLILFWQVHVLLVDIDSYSVDGFSSILMSFILST